MKITVQQALQATNQLQQSKLSNCTGDAAIAVYFLGNDIEQGFKKHFEDFREAAGGDGPELTDEQVEILQKEEDINLTRGKLTLESIKDYTTPRDLTLLDFAIDFGD